ncbi:MAG: hypothetical protein CSB55_03045 [Candidatus Cloacimonadota bacterium]|nr:MAG: hypothetical protein CSB55_03045 [Candidatus Cloacimonadota bacterium]
MYFAWDISDKIYFIKSGEIVFEMNKEIKSSYLNAKTVVFKEKFPPDEEIKHLLKFMSNNKLHLLIKKDDEFLLEKFKRNKINFETKNCREEHLYRFFLGISE